MQTTALVLMLFLGSSNAIQLQTKAHNQLLERLRSKNHQSKEQICTQGFKNWQDQDAINQMWRDIPRDGKFVDHQFPANMNSLWQTGYVASKNENMFNDGLGKIDTWRRPSEIVYYDPNASADNVEVCRVKNCEDYRGKQNQTTKGDTCVRWDAFGTSQYSPGRNPGKGLEENYCRNFDNSSAAWCFTDRESLAWGKCRPLTENNKSNLASLWGSKGIQPAGVDQGGLGDCWFLVSAAGLAEHPERVQKLFDNTEYPDNGAFKVNFFNKGEPVSVIIDDQLPMKANKPYSPIMAEESINGGWWMPILEKAYAKYNVFYANIKGGNSMASFRDLTGMPAIEYQVNDLSNEDMFRILLDADQKKWIAVASCDVIVDGLQNGHAYTMLGAVTLQDQDGVSWDLLKMRNPWAKEGYTGPWNDKDSRWTPELMAKVGHKDANDGVFFLPITTFREAFYRIHIGMYQDWKVDRWYQTGDGVKETKYLTSPVNQDAILTIDWTPQTRLPRYHCKEFRGQHKYNVFLKNLETGVELQEGGWNSWGYTYIKFEGGMQAGVKYSVKVYDFGSQVDHDYTVTIYSEDQQVQFKDSFYS